MQMKYTSCAITYIVDSLIVSLDEASKPLFHWRDNNIIKSQKEAPRGFPGEGVLEICSKFTGEHSCRSLLKSHFGMGVFL